MKIQELLEEINKNKSNKRFGKKLGSLASAAMLSLAPGNFTDNIPDETSQQVQHISAPKPFYKIGQPYIRHGVKYTPKFISHYDKKGIASYYGSDFHGKKTANADVFDMHNLTAASPTLPLFSRVWVTNLENDKKVLVTVNDRGPYANGRIMDLSKAAAQALDFVDKGTAKVRVHYDKVETEKYLKKMGLYDQYLKKAKLQDKN